MHHYWVVMKPYYTSQWWHTQSMTTKTLKKVAFCNEQQNNRAKITCRMFSPSAHERVGEENVSMTDEKLRHNSLYTDVLQSSQAALLLLQIFTSVTRHLILNICYISTGLEKKQEYNSRHNFSSKFRHSSLVLRELYWYFSVLKNLAQHCNIARWRWRYIIKNAFFQMKTNI